jgi:putative hydrolase of the HAD superfamily
VTISAVTFDCWGTLITDSDLDRPYDVRVAAVLEAGGGALDREGAEALLRRAWDEHHRAWVNGVQYGSSGMARFCADELGSTDDLICDRLQEAFEEAGRHGTLEALPGAVDALRTLRGSGIRTALVCDTGLTPGRVVRDFLADVGVLPHLEYCAFSNEVGEPKPGEKIFRAALDAIGSAPDEAAHVGDLLRTDIYGARAIGMKTIRITAVNDDVATRFSWDPQASFGRQSDGSVGPGEVDDADAVVASLADLVGALRRLGAEL